MPFRDRYWWLVRLGGIVLALSMAGIVGWILWQSPIIFPDLWGGDVGRLISNNALLLAFCGLFFLQGIAIVRSSAQARDRYNRRRAALQGDQDAIPVARITVHPENAPDVVESPLVLRWTASQVARLILAPMYVFLCLLSFAVPILMGVIFLSAPSNGTWRSPDLGLVSFLMPAAVLLTSIVIFPLVGVILLIRDIPTSFGRPFGLSVNCEGILCVGETGRRRFLRWEEMRLLEVMTNSAYVSRTFRVYGPGTAIEWSLLSAGATYVPDGISPAEMEARTRSLLDLINARTGLVPRTFDVRRESLGKGQTIAARGCLVALVLATLAFVAGLILLPVTTSRLLNLALMGTLIYICVAVGISMVVSMLRERRQGHQRDDASQVSDDSAAAHMLIFGATVTSRITNALSGLILCVDLVPATLWLLSTLSLPPHGLYPRIIGTFGYVASLVLLPIGLFGLGMIVWALWSRVTSITANAAGLTERHGRKTTSIAWNDVEHVRGVAPKGTVTAYNVQGASVAIWWSANGTRAPRPRDGEGVLPITANGLANLVAARTGKALTVGEHTDLLGDESNAVS